MGFWGSGLYANDTTCDVRDSYLKLLQEEFCNEKAYKTIIEEYKDLIGDDDEPLFWYALAETQWRLGRLLPEVKEKALDWIEKNGGLEGWEESKNGGIGWKKTLQSLKKKLNSPMTSEKKIRKPQEINRNLWNINDVYAYKFHRGIELKHDMDNKYILIQKIGEGIDKSSGKTTMRIQVFDRVFDYLPTLNDVGDIRILPLDFPTRVNMKDDPIWMSALIHRDRKSDYPEKCLTFVGNKQGPPNNRIVNRNVTWCDIDRWLSNFYRLWQGIEYETIGEGVYRYRQ